MIGRTGLVTVLTACLLGAAPVVAQTDDPNPLSRPELARPDAVRPGQREWRTDRRGDRLERRGMRLERKGSRLDRRGERWERRGRWMARHGHPLRGRAWGNRGERLEHRGFRFERRGDRWQRRRAGLHREGMLERQGGRLDRGSERWHRRDHLGTDGDPRLRRGRLGTDRRQLKGDRPGRHQEDDRWRQSPGAFERSGGSGSAAPAELDREASI
jgi:hypothetical protein